MVSQGQIYEGTSPVTKKVSPDFFESRFIIMQMSDPLFSETMFPRKKTFCLFPANLATPGNIRNNVSATMFRFKIQPPYSISSH